MMNQEQLMEKIDTAFSWIVERIDDIEPPYDCADTPLEHIPVLTKRSVRVDNTLDVSVRVCYAKQEGVEHPHFQEILDKFNESRPQYLSILEGLLKCGLGEHTAYYDGFRFIAVVKYVKNDMIKEYKGFVVTIENDTVKVGRDLLAAPTHQLQKRFYPLGVMLDENNPLPEPTTLNFEFYQIGRVKNGVAVGLWIAEDVDPELLWDTFMRYFMQDGEQA